MKGPAGSSSPVVAKKATGYESVTWGPIAAVLVTIALFFASNVVASVLLILGSIAFDGQSLDSLKDGGVISTAPYQFLGSLLVGMSLVALLYRFLKYKKTSFKALGFRRFSWKKLLAYGAAGTVIYLTVNIFVSVVINAFWPDILNQQQDIGFSRQAGGWLLIPIFVSLVIVPPIVEEILVRGFLFSGLRRHLDFIYAALITSALFGIAHLQGGGSRPLVWAAVIDTFVLSLVLCWLRERTGSLWAPILLHGVKNGLAFATIFIFR